MKLSKLKTILLLIITPLMLFFAYSIYEDADNIMEDKEVIYHLKKVKNQYQVIHNSKLYGTNYSILVEFEEFEMLEEKETNYVKKMNFVLTNYGGPIHFKIEKVTMNDDKNFNIYLKKSFFKSENLPLQINFEEGEYEITIGGANKDNHIKVKNFFGDDYSDEKTLLGFDKLNGNKYCCGRRCKFNYTN